VTAGVYWLQGDASRLANWGEEIRKQIFDEVGKLMDEVMTEAAAKMRDFISSRGLPNSAGAGRIDSGNMLNAVDSQVTIDGQVIDGTFGWLEGGEVYFLAQEEGAVLWNGGVIMPMLALYDAGQWAIQEFISKLGAALG
jgi:hypothetical protein